MAKSEEDTFAGSIFRNWFFIEIHNICIAKRSLWESIRCHSQFQNEFINSISSLQMLADVHYYLTNTEDIERCTEQQRALTLARPSCAIRNYLLFTIDFACLDICFWLSLTYARIDSNYCFDCVLSFPLKRCHAKSKLNAIIVNKYERFIAMQTSFSLVDWISENTQFHSTMPMLKYNTLFL